MDPCPNDKFLNQDTPAPSGKNDVKSDFIQITDSTPTHLPTRKSFLKRCHLKYRLHPLTNRVCHKGLKRMYLLPQSSYQIQI